MKKVLTILMVLCTPAAAQNYLRDDGIFHSVVEGTTDGQLLQNQSGLLGGISLPLPLVIGTTPITGTPLTGVLYNNSGFLGASSVFTFTPTLGVNLAPAAASNNPALTITQSTPSGSVAGPISLNLITVTDGTQTVTGGFPVDQWGQITNQTNVFRTNLKVTGGSANHFGINSAVQVTATNGGSVGLLGTVYANSPGNTITGDLWGIIGVGQVGPITNLNQSLIGIEAEMLVADTGLVKDRVGVGINSQGPTKGSTTDAGIVFSTFNLGVANFLTAAPFNDGIYFSTSFYASSTFPIATTGNIMRGDTGTVANFANFANLTVTGNIDDFPNFKVSGTGGAILGQASTAAPASGLQIKSALAGALLVGANSGTANQAFTVDASNGAGNGVYVYSTAASSAANITIVSSTTNENLNINAKGTGQVKIGTASVGSPSTGGLLVTSPSAGALQVGPNGATNPTFVVDDSTASAANGVYVFSTAAGSGANITTISSTTNEPLKLNAKGSGTIDLAGTSTGGVTVHGSFTATGLVTNADLATMVTNTIKGNATSGTASPTDLAVGSCSTASSALIWTTNTGFGCNTSITAAAVPASGLTGTTLASNVVTSSLTALGTITSLTATTINAFTLGGTISGGGNALNNIVIGGTTPLAGTFTTLTGNTSVTSPLHYGGSAAGSTITVSGTSNGSPASAYVLLQSGTTQFVGINNATPKTTLDVNVNTSSSPALILSSSVARFQAADAASSGAEFTSYGAGGSAGIIIAGGAAAGTSASPTATAISQYMYNMRGYGYNSGWQLGGIWIMRSSEAWSAGHQGVAQDWYTTPNASTTIALAMTLQASGGLSIGTTTDPGIGSLQINANIFAPNLPTTTAALGAAVCWTATTGQFQRDTNAGGCLVSSERYKHNIIALFPSDMLNEIMAMRPVAFDYNDNVGIRGRQVGFIAEQLATVDERLVGFNYDGSAQSAKYMQSTAILAGAIQQLKADNDNLNAEVQSLKRGKL